MHANGGGVMGRPLAFVTGEAYKDLMCHGGERASQEGNKDLHSDV